jgi:glycosyltransferase involved in cell wall biosynthesis
MKIMFLTREYPPFSVGGVAKYVYWLSRSLTKLGVECKVLSFGNPSESNEEVLFVTPVSSFSAKRTSAKDNLLLFQDLKTINRLADELFAKGNFDVIHVADPYLGPYLNSPNIVTTVHDTSVGELRFMLGNIRTVTDLKYSIFFAFLGPWLEQLTIRKSKSIIAVNDHIKHELCRSYGISARKIEVITNGVEIPKTVLKDTAKDKLSLPINELLVFSACRLIPRKRMDLLIEAVKILVESGEKAFSVVICGDGPQRLSLLSKVNKYGLSEKIRFTGWVSEENLRLYYEAADIFVLSSEYEGFPISLLEALANSAAPVCSNISPMILTEGINGLIFERGNSKQLAEKLRMLIKNSELRLSISNAGRELAKRFDWEKVALDVKKTYENLPERRK